MENVCYKQTEDVALLRLLVEELQPQSSQLNEEQSCLEWMGQYSAVTPVVLRILRDTDGIPFPASAAENACDGQEKEYEEEGKAVRGLPFGVRCLQQLTVIRYWCCHFSFYVFCFGVCVCVCVCVRVHVCVCVCV